MTKEDQRVLLQRATRLQEEIVALAQEILQLQQSLDQELGEFCDIDRDRAPHNNSLADITQEMSTYLKNRTNNVTNGQP